MSLSVSAEDCLNFEKRLARFRFKLATFKPASVPVRVNNNSETVVENRLKLKRGLPSSSSIQELVSLEEKQLDDTSDALGKKIARVAENLRGANVMHEVDIMKSIKYFVSQNIPDDLDSFSNGIVAPSTVISTFLSSKDFMGDILNMEHETLTTNSH
jgi:hypothetical protein